MKGLVQRDHPNTIRINIISRNVVSKNHRLILSDVFLPMNDEFILRKMLTLCHKNTRLMRFIGTGQEK
jgi:hypothetical protein